MSVGKPERECERDSIGSLFELQSLTVDQHEAREKPIFSFFSQLSFWRGIRKWISPH